MDYHGEFPRAEESAPVGQTLSGLRKGLFVASHASAVKAHRQSVRRQQLNREQRSRLRSQLKAIRAAKGEKAAEDVKAAISLIDRMAGKGIIHKNAAARYKSRLATKAR